MFSPRALVGGIPVRAKFAPKNSCGSVAHIIQGYFIGAGATACLRQPWIIWVKFQYHNKHQLSTNPRVDVLLCMDVCGTLCTTLTFPTTSVSGGFTNVSYENSKLKLCIFGHTCNVSAWNSHRTCDFLALCIFARLFWRARETLVKQPPVRSNGCQPNRV